MEGDIAVVGSKPWTVVHADGPVDRISAGTQINAEYMQHAYTCWQLIMRKCSGCLHRPGVAAIDSDAAAVLVQRQTSAA